LSLLARFTDNFDCAARENAYDFFGVLVWTWSGDFNKRFHLLLLVVNVGDEQLFPYTSADVGSSSWRIIDIERFARSTGPVYG
jgi:hypothetical protein